VRPDLSLSHEFVEHIPKELKDNTLYISVMFATAVHKCCCGCGNEVVTPFSPTDWTLVFDGDSVSLEPSIGNWNFPCRSHYWIRRNKVRWAPRWSEEQIKAGRARDRLEKRGYFGGEKIELADRDSDTLRSSTRETIWRKLKRWLLP
jgi:hypothetical protein